MSKLKEKKVTTLLIGMILGIVISGTCAYAAIIYQSSQVSYSNSTSGLSSTNVQDAIDELSSINSNFNALLTMKDMATENSLNNIKIFSSEYWMCIKWPKGFDCFSAVFEVSKEKMDKYFDLMGIDGDTYYYDCNGAYCPACTIIEDDDYIKCCNSSQAGLGGGCCTANYSSVSCT